MPELTFATWFHADGADHPGTYAQALGDASAASHHEVYLRCVDVCVASHRRWNPEGSGLVVLNEDAARSISPSRSRFWTSLDVDVVTTTNTHVPDADLYDGWQNQFFLFDVLDVLLARVAPEDGLAVVDSDVLVRGSLDPLSARIQQDARVSMSVGYTEDAEIHGLTRVRLAALHATWSGRRLSFIPEYLGGEFVAGTGSAMAELRAACESVYAWSLLEQSAGRPHPAEEAHIISVADPVRASEVNGNDLVERIWTQPWKYREVSPTAVEKPLWHVPAEKRTGIRLLHSAVLNRESWFWTASDAVWHERTQQVLGVPRYGFTKAVRDAVALGGGGLRRLGVGSR